MSYSSMFITIFLISIHLLYSYVHPPPSHPTTRLSFESSKIDFNSLKHDRKSFLSVIHKRSRQEGSKQLNGQERKHLNDLLRTHVISMDGSSLASLVSSLGHLDNLHREGILCSTQLSQVCEQLNSYEMASTLLGLGRLGVDWEQVSGKDRVYARIARLLQHMDDRCISDTLYAIGLLNFRWNKLPPILQASIMNAISKTVSRVNSFSLSSMTWSLAKIGIKWSELPEGLQQSLISKLKSQKDLSPQQSSKILWSLGSLGFPNKHFPEGYLDQLLDNINKIKRSKMGFAISASQTLTGIAKTGLVWEDISAKSKNSIWEQFMRVSQSTNDKGIANAVWAMGTICNT